MRRSFIYSCLAVCFLFVHDSPVGSEAGQEKPIAFRNARLLTAAGAPIERGVLVIHRGKIVAIGPVETTAVPANAEVRDMTGTTIIPGLVDTHSHVGVYSRPRVPAHADGNEMSGPVQAGIRAIDAINPDDPGIRMALAGGVTTANIMPGSGNVIGGQTLYVKFRGRTVEEMHIAHPDILGGLKMANGENPKGYSRRDGKAPFTRMKIAALQREEFIKAREYQRKWQAFRQEVATGTNVLPPTTDIALHTLVEVLERKRTVHFHCHRADDIMTAVRMAEEFGFELVLQHATEAYRVAEELAAKKIPVSLTLVDSPGGKMETAGLLEENAAILERAGVPVAINTDDSITESRFFLRTGAIAVRGGMSPEEALKALTINPARMMHLDKRLGSLEAGKDADFVVLSGDPFSVYTQVLETYIEGVRLFNRSQRKDWAYQVGGFALPELDRLPATLTTPAPLPPVKAPEMPAGAIAARGAPARLVVLAGRVHTVANGTITDAAIMVEEGKIRYVGPRSELAIPPQTPVVTAAVVTPGLIDAHSVVPLTGLLNIPADQEQDERSDPNQANLRVIDAFNPNEPLLQFFRENGVTVVHATPGPANVIAGQTGIFRTNGRTVDQMTIQFPAGVLVNLGESPKATYRGRLPTTRMGTASIVRAALAASRERQRPGGPDRNASDRGGPTGTPATGGAPNPKSEALELVLAGKIPMIFSAHRADDINTALRIAREFNIPARLSLATEAYLIPDVIAEANVPVVVHPTMQRVGGMETYNSFLGNAAVLAGRKVPMAMGTAFESYVPKTRVLRHEAAMAMVNGLGHDQALRAVTLDAAKILGIDDRYGSLEVGKVADLILYNGDPFEHATHVTHTIMAGRIVYDRAEYLKIPFARRALPLIGGEGGGCCLD